MIWLINNWRTLLWCLLMLCMVLFAFTTRYYQSEYHEERGRADAAESLAQQRQGTITDMQRRQRDIAALDKKYTQELADAKAENAALQHKLDHGGRVLVTGRCPATAPDTAAAPGVGDDATLELSSTAGRHVLGIRAGIKQDQSALKVLQEYILSQCLN